MTAPAAGAAAKPPPPAPNWSGWDARAVPFASGKFTDATATWTVPAASGLVGAQVSVWTGLGGTADTGATPLVQAGTTSVPGGAYAWTEVYNSSRSWKSYILVLGVLPGDQMSVSVKYEGLYPDAGYKAEAGTYRFLVSDTRYGLTAWRYDSGAVKIPEKGVPTSAEWIVEQPKGALSLADFAPVYINGGYVAVVVNGQPPVTFGKYQMPGTTVSGFDSQGGFTVTKP
jgi:hypothetical protein